jgi:chloramphenicol-sensitive protein RarD
VFAYTWWGLVPLYFAVLKRYGLSAGEILAQRITWSVPLLLMLASGPAARRQWRVVLSDRSLLLTLAASASLLAINWLLYIFATVTDRVTEASLGYFMMPLVNAVLATVVLRERLRPAHYPALALIALAVAIPIFVHGRGSWLAIALPVTFGLYSVVRKQAAVDSVIGLTVETVWLLPFSVAYLLWLALHGENHLRHSPAAAAWIVLSGVVTVAPLLAFILSLRRLTLLAVSFIQFISPTVQMLIAVTLLGEKLESAQWLAFICVWGAVLIFLIDAVQAAQRPAPVRTEPGPTSATGATAGSATWVSPTASNRS